VATVSTPAKLSSVKSVLGGAGSLFAYRRGNLTPNINHFSSINTGNPVVLSAFAGKIYPVVALPILNPFAVQPTPTTAICTMSYSSTGTATGTNSTSGTWLLAGVNSNYEILLNKTSGITPTGDSVNTWMALSTSRSWSLSVSNGLKECSGWLAIRDTLNNVTLSNSAFTMATEST
jgi:hypothetical protein